MGTNRTFRRRPNTELFWGKVVKTNGCWEWIAGTNEKGYGIFLCWKAHRYSAHLHGIIPTIDSSSLVLHRCDNPRCVRPDHLYAGTHKDNMRDMAVRGRARNQYT